MITPFNLALCAIALTALIGAGWGIHHHIWQAGFDQCKSEQAQAITKAASTSRVKINNQERVYEAHKKAVYTVQGDNPAAGPHVAAALNGLPSSGSGDSK